MEALDTVFRRIARHECGIDRADRDAGDPVRFDMRMSDPFIDTRLVGAKCAATLEDQGNLFVGWKGYFVHGILREGGAWLEHRLVIGIIQCGRLEMERVL